MLSVLVYPDCGDYLSNLNYYKGEENIIKSKNYQD